MFDGFKGQPPDRSPESKGEKTFVWALVFIFGGLLVAGFWENYSPRMLSVPFFLLSWPILLVIHEFGHALCAHWLGWEVEKVSIGTGPVRAGRTLFGMKVEFRTVPLSGFARIRAADLIQPRLKNCLIYAAGPGVEIALVIVLALILGGNTLLTLTDSVGIIAVQAFCVASLLGAITNLIPFPHHTENGVAWSDGMGMIASWRLPDEYFASQIKSA